MSSNNFSIPNNNHPVLNSDGTMNRIWYLYLQGLGGVASGSAIGNPQVNTIAGEPRPPAGSLAQPVLGQDEPAHANQAVQQAASTAPVQATSEHDTEPTQNVANVAAIAQQTMQSSQMNSFFGAPPVAQPRTTGNTHTVGAGSTTQVFTNTTFDGSAGSTAYTVGDIVSALKALGFLQT